jgi:anti-sigma B factor antagonist
MRRGPGAWTGRHPAGARIVQGTPLPLRRMSDDDLQPELETTLDVGDGHVTLRASGEIDLYSAGDFTAALGQAADTAPDVTVDLTGVRFMDSTGLRALLRARRRAEDEGGRLRLAVDPSGAVARLLDLAGVSALFEGVESRAEQD